MIKPGFSILALVSVVCLPSLASAEDNIAACEVVIQQEVALPGDGVEVAEEERTKEELVDAASSPMIATFIPATDFIFSVFDEEPGHLTQIKGKPIEALMCKRRYLVPTEFDLRLIKTRIPLYLSQDFDSPDSGLMSVFFKDNQYQYVYSGDTISEDSLAILETRMLMLNAEQSQEE